MFDPRRLIARACAAAFHVAAKLRLTAWISRHVVIPDGVGVAEPGPLDTSRVPPVEGLYTLLDQPHVHFFTLAKSARVGGTLFCFAYLIYRLITAPGPVLWIDPTRATMRQLPPPPAVSRVLGCCGSYVAGTACERCRKCEAEWERIVRAEDVRALAQEHEERCGDPPFVPQPTGFYERAAREQGNHSSV